jgi:DNA repair protein RecN (Recombination protein N)
VLNLLHIKNVAVIEKADLSFGPGLNVLTGETGAGKSIVIDAIGALIGGRVSKDIVRTGADSALITAQFDMDDMIKSWLSDNDLEPPEDDVLLISRKITSDGRSTCRVNGVPLSVSQLRQLGQLLIDIHGQNDGQKLLGEANHRAYLDAFGGLEESAGRCRELYRKFRETQRAYEELKKSEKDKELRIEELQRQINEITSANPKHGEQEELLERRHILKNAGRLTEYVEKAYYALYGDENSSGALPLLMDAEADVEAASRISETIGELAESMRDVRYRLEDVTGQLAELRESLDFSPGELESLEGRLALLQRLERRYGSVEDMLDRLEKAQKELEDMENLSERLEAFRLETEKRRQEMLKTAKQLSDKRKKAAKTLQARIAEELKQLSMPGVRFEVEFVKKDEPDETGLDGIRFLMSANVGEAMGRISRIASGGELSRIMLAMKNVLSSTDNVGILIFDEIDSGVSGVAAQRVGEKLAELAETKQILCVTHLPQIAVMADKHYSIEKKQIDNRTYTIVNPLDIKGRKKELARLIGGDNVTDVTLSGAGELLEAASKFKERKKSL